MFDYLFLHFVNHSLGSIASEGTESGAVSRNPSEAVRSARSRSMAPSRCTTRSPFWAIYITRDRRMGRSRRINQTPGFDPDSAVGSPSSERPLSADCVEKLPFGDVRFSGRPMGAAFKKISWGTSQFSV